MQYRRTVSYPTQPNKEDETHVFPIVVLPKDHIARVAFEAGTMDEVTIKTDPLRWVTYTKVKL